MKSEYDVIVIGGSAAGIPAAITTRRYYKDKSILIIRKDTRVPIPCGIPYIFGTVGGVDKNLIPDAVLEKNSIDLLVGRVNSINKEEKSVSVDGKNLNYQKMILATGSKPMIPPIKGVDLKNVFAVHKDTTYLSQVLEEVNKAKDIVIIGGGFIGVEFAEECKKNRNVNVTLVELKPKCLMAAFDDEFCDEAEKILKEQDIKLLTNSKVTSCNGNELVKEVELSDGTKIPADVVILGIGAIPNADLAQAANLEMGKCGGIKVNSNLKTSDDNIYACGDCVDAKSFFNDDATSVKLASTATTQARIVGANLFQTKRSDRGIIGVFSTALSNQAFACAGLTEREALANGYQIAIGMAEGPNRHPGGMPGMQNMKVKLIFNCHDNSIIGGQIFGALSGGEMINAISTFILNKMKADEIATFQMGTHPALTASPIAYHIVNAAEMANIKMI